MCVPRCLVTRLISTLLLSVLPHAASAQDFFPLNQVHAGLKGVGRSVFQGEKIEEFQFEVLGVLTNIAPSQTIVLAKLSGGPLSETGVLQGMSGSPVYINGKLLGAVALGFPYSKEAIAGIQPIEPMVKDATPGFKSQARLTNPPVAGQLTNLPVPVSFSGFSTNALTAFSDQFSKLGFRVQQGLAAQSVNKPSTTGEIQPGSMISVGLITGDMNMTADGTVTYVDGKRIYAFGHRFLDAGNIEMPFAHSEVIALIPSVNASFKLSAPHAWLGSIMSDRGTGIAGEIGRLPHMVPLEINVDSATTGLHSYHMQVVNDRILAPFLSQTALLSTLDATERSVGAGTLRIEGRAQFEGGLPDLLLRDIYVSDTALSAQAATSSLIPLGFVVGGGFTDLKLKSMSFKISEVDAKKQLRLVQAWASAHEARPGDTVSITMQLEGENGYETTKEVKYQIPVGAAAGALNFTIGDAMVQNFAEFAGMNASSAQNATRLIEQINRYHSSEGLYIRVWKPQPAFVINGPGPDNEMPDPPPSAMLVLADPSASAAGSATNAAVRGSEIAQLTVSVPGFSLSGAKTIQVDVHD